VTAVSPNDAWAVGSINGNALVEHFDGTSWSEVSSPAFTGVGLVAVSADASNDVWAVGEGSTGQAILHFDGTNWSQASSLPRMQPNGVIALSPTNVWAVGSVSVFFNHRAHNQAAIEHWDGTSWSLVASPNPAPGGNSALEGIAAISANDIWAVGGLFGPSKTLTEHFDGTSWTVIPSPNPAQNQNDLFGVTALSDGTVAAVGHQEDVNTDQPLILMNAASAPRAMTRTAALIDAHSAATVSHAEGHSHDALVDNDLAG
jgi:hypothetical protein